MNGTVTPTRTLTAMGALAAGAVGAAELLRQGLVGEAAVMVSLSVMAFVGIQAAPGQVLTSLTRRGIRKARQGLRKERAAVSSSTGAVALGLAGALIALGGQPWGGVVVVVAAVALGSLAVQAARPRKPHLRLIRGGVGSG